MRCHATHQSAVALKKDRLSSPYLTARNLTIPLMKSTSRSHQLTVTELLELVESSDVKRKRQSFVGAVCFFSVLSATAFFSVFGTKGWKECTEDPHSTEESGKKKQLYLPGIRNFGNNCFLNVILQVKQGNENICGPLAS